MQNLAGSHANLLLTLLASAGEADTALAALATMNLPHGAAAERARLGAGHEADPRCGARSHVDRRSGGESRFCLSHRRQLHDLRARSAWRAWQRRALYGRQRDDRSAGPHGEPATGFTLYVDEILRVLPSAAERASRLRAHGHARRGARQLRAQGWTTLSGLGPVDDPVAEARRLGCTHAYLDGRVVELPPG